MADDLCALQEAYPALLHRLLPARPVSPVHERIQMRPTHNGDAHVERVGGLLHYVVTERGAELDRRVARDEDELLYWLIDDVTSSISWHTRRSLFSTLLRRDTRQTFKMHVKLLKRVDAAWAERTRARYAAILRRYPYRRQA